MKPNTKLLILSAFIAPVLIACGGGGGGGATSSSPVPDNLSDIDWAVNAAAARQAVPGSEPLTITPGQVEQESDAINANLDAANVSDVLAYQGVGGLVRVPTACAGLNCTLSFPDGSTEQLNLDDSEPSTGTAEYQAIMTHNGVSMGQLRSRGAKGTPDQFELISYGGWLSYSAFEVVLTSSPSLARPELSLALAASYGDSSGTNPSERTGMTATWEGVMAGADMGSANQGNFIHGEATATVDFANSSLDVTFSNLVDLNDANNNSALNSLNWVWQNINLTNGDFSTGSGPNQIKGRFYGPNHEEVSATFERNQVIGAFGAIRGSTQ